MDGVTTGYSAWTSPRARLLLPRQLSGIRSVHLGEMVRPTPQALEQRRTSIATSCTKTARLSSIPKACRPTNLVPPKGGAQRPLFLFEREHENVQPPSQPGIHDRGVTD